MIDQEEIIPYAASNALVEIKAMWLSMARTMASYNANLGDWLEDAAGADTAIAMAARAEACFWRATGDCDAIDAGLFVKELAQGTETGTAETEGLGPKDDGPVPQACAQTGGR